MHYIPRSIFLYFRQPVKSREIDVLAKILTRHSAPVWRSRVQPHEAWTALCPIGRASCIACSAPTSIRPFHNPQLPLFTKQPPKLVNCTPPPCSCNALPWPSRAVPPSLPFCDAAWPPRPSVVSRRSPFRKFESSLKISHLSSGSVNSLLGPAQILCATATAAAPPIGRLTDLSVF